MQYKYETHLHTSEVSACGRASAAEQVAFYAQMGYSGIIITDHFFNGNTTVPREGLSWSEMVERFCEGYNNALEAGKEYGIDVFFGWEYSYRGTDFLTYGLSPKWLLENPGIMNLSHWEYCDFIRDNGGLVIHAHPYREAGYIEEIRLNPRSVDGVEVFNACRTDFENSMAEKYAESYELLKFSGSDNHSSYAMKRLGGIKTGYKLESISDFVELIKSGKYRIIKEKVKLK